MGQYNFQIDLANSQTSVDMVIDKIVSMGATNIELCHNKDYDLTYNAGGLGLSLEVKEDMMYDITGNVAIEYMCNGKLSGVSSSKASGWVYKLGDELYFCDITTLKGFLKSKPFRRVSGGDGMRAKMLLVPIKDFKTAFVRL
jgi:hypothetical protein